jgi:hypothetical protein
MIGEHVLQEYLQHVTTNQKSDFFDGTRSQFSRRDLTLFGFFLDFSLQLWSLLAKFAAILATRGTPLEAFK